ncbi:MAG: M14 family zinc carboxypeptidase [Planctomycetota bacterium]
MRRLILTLGFLSLAVGLCAGNTPFPFQGNESYEGKLKTPEQFFGVPLGSRFTSHSEVLRYCRYLAETSPRVQLFSYGVSGEGRELIYLIISETEHIKNLESIRERQSRLADPRLLESSKGEVSEEFLAQLPVIVWLSYNVHGNEASGTEAALRTAYQLSDGSDLATVSIRSNVVTILDPLLNPDGRERYRTWYHQVAAPGGNPDPNAREHAELWPGGRTNHYYFDLNRDWSWLSQPETRARIPEYLRWQPLVHVDFHEMSPESTYFFFPAEKPINTNFPEHTLRWGKIFGRANAHAFDRFGWLYYTAESFDLFYPGYGDTWPSLHGAIGMTYEQAGGPRAGLTYRRRNGEILTLTQRLHHHFVSGMATLLCAAEHKTDLQRSFHDFRRSATMAGGEVREYVFPAGQGERLRRFAQLLLDQGIEVESTQREAVAESLQDYHGERKEVVKLPAGSLVVSLAQPAGRLAKALLEPEAEVTENRFYDVSAWSLPFAMGLKGYFTSQSLAVERVPLRKVPETPGSVAGKARYTYLLPWDGLPAVRALIHLQSQGIRTRLIPKPIAVAGNKLARGVLQVPVGGAQATVHEAVQGAAAAAHVQFLAVNSGWTEDGIDLGSELVLDLVPPRIALATGPGVSSTSCGAIWFLLERELEIPFTSFGLERLARLELDRFNVLILPNGSGYRRQLNEKVRQRLKAWVQEGGVLIAIGGGAFALTKEQTGFTEISEKPAETKNDEEKKDPVRRKIEELRQQRRERQVPGNIFRIDLDEDHPLAFGLPQYVFVFMGGTRSFAVSESERDVGAFTDDPAVSGYISEENIEKVRRRVYLAEEAQGRGRVILFSGDPNFRLFWHGLTPLFLNAVFLRCSY